MNEFEEGPATDWLSILNAEVDEADDYVEITPERVAILSLIDCHEQLQKSATEVGRLALAAKSAHLAVQAALTAALAGTANIGAHPEKLRVAHLRYFEERRTNSVDPPGSDRVMSFPDLLSAATESPLPWTQEPVHLDASQRALLDRLTLIRHDVEHPKQRTHAIEPAYIKETLPVAAQLSTELLETVFHHLEPGEVDQLQRLAEDITALCE